MKSFPRAIAHIDADCFFVSVERLSRPELRGKPVMVCSRTDRRGVVVSASYEARAYGVAAGMAVFQAQQRCPKGFFTTSHFENYGLISARMGEIFREFSPDVEMASIDEAYVDLTGLRLLWRSDYPEIGRRIQETIEQKLGITVSIGISCSKTLAKIASDRQKPHGFTVVRQQDISSFLRQVPARDVPGVGQNTEALLKKFGLETALDLAASEQIPKLLGKRGIFLQEELSGRSLSPVSLVEERPKSMSASRSFTDFTSDEHFIFSFSSELLRKLCFRLREYELKTSHLHFFLTTKNFTTSEAAHRLETKSDDDTVLFPIFQKLWKQCFTPGLLYRKSGFSFSIVDDHQEEQLCLFQENKNSVKSALDSIYRRFGLSAIRRGLKPKIAPTTRQK